MCIEDAAFLSRKHRSRSKRIRQAVVLAFGCLVTENAYYCEPRICTIYLP